MIDHAKTPSGNANADPDKNHPQGQASSRRVAISESALNESALNESAISESAVNDCRVCVFHWGNTHPRAFHALAEAQIPLIPRMTIKPHADSDGCVDCLLRSFHELSHGDQSLPSSH